MEAYGQDLAYIHDVGYGAFAQNAAPGVLDIIQKTGVDTGLAVDLGCGSGIWARHLVNAGYDVLGVDISKEMIAIARRRVPEAEFLVESLLDVDLPQCAAVTSLGECCNYLFDPKNRRTSLRKLFRRIYRALRPGGVFVFDVAEPGRDHRRARHFNQTDDWACLVEFEEDPRSARLTRHITTFRKQGKNYRRAEETHVLQLYKGTELADDLCEIGFKTRIVRSYGDYQLPKNLVGLIARKP